MNLKHFSLNPLAGKRKAKMQFFWSLFIYNGTLHVLVERRETFEYVSCYFLALMCQFIMTGIRMVKSILGNTWILNSALMLSKLRTRICESGILSTACRQSREDHCVICDGHFNEKILTLLHYIMQCKLWLSIGSFEYPGSDIVWNSRPDIVPISKIFCNCLKWEFLFPNTTLRYFRGYFRYLHGYWLTVISRFSRNVYWSQFQSYPWGFLTSFRLSFLCNTTDYIINLW